MKQLERVAIVGVGLIGGSVGLGLRERSLAREIVGVGRRAETLETAKQVGAITRGTCDLAEGVAGAELVVVCTPVGRIVDHVRRAAANAPTALITDAGSTKAAIVQELEAALPPEARFVGSHPLAGSHEKGPAHARADLFEGRVVVVTSTERTRSEDEQAVREFWEALGAKTMWASPAGHDQALAATSHVPHVVASALIGAVPRDHFNFAATGLRDTTRIAAADAELWAQIVLANRESVLKSLDAFSNSLSIFQDLIERGDQARLVQLLAVAKEKRDALGD